MKNYKFISIFAFLFAALTIVSCQKEFETPPLEEIPQTPVMTIGELRDWQNTQGGKISIQDELSVFGIVTMDEADGNIFRNVYLQDHTGAINVRLVNSGGLYQGDSVRVYLKGTILNKFSGVLQLDSVDVDLNIVKQSTNNNFIPEVVGIDEITVLKESQLIQLNNVQFIKPQLTETYADGINLISEDRILEDIDGNTIKIRSSGFASFADEMLPSGAGSLVCVVSHFNGSIQLLIRSFKEINLTGERFPGQLLSKNFDDESVTSNGWTTHKVIGDTEWETSSAGGSPTEYGVISNFVDGSNFESENWLISPAIDLTAGDSPTLNFDNAVNFSGPAISILISENYDGISDPTTQGDWTAVPAILSSGGFVWVNSGEIPLGAFISDNVHIAFRYIGTNSDGSTWELDNITIVG